MKSYRCRTNLDEGRKKTWPTDFVTCPRVGDYVQASEGYRLKVVSIMHTTHKERFMGEDILAPNIEVELNR
jgi:hypothetical protein